MPQLFHSSWGGVCGCALSGVAVSVSLNLTDIGRLPLYTILHISDLHRMEGRSVTNQELFSSLVADFQRSARETPALTRPDAIVVSGDLVEGLRLGSANYPDSLRLQYQEAEELLVLLVNEFLGGDRSRIVIVPGNHDVDWNGVRQAFELEQHPPENLRGFISSPDASYRWSWTDRQVFRISDLECYQRRFQYFEDMYKHFYQNVSLTHSVDPSRPWNLFCLDDGNILVAGFNSCIVNDCFSDIGHIRSSDVADCHLAMRPLVRPECLPIAVWHHGVGGSPWSSDYLDTNTVKLMIDKGFRLGLHGHRHDSSIAPVDLFLSTRETLAVIGAGSLCAGEKALPHGINHRYNVIQVNRQEKTGMVHVREMNQAGIWGPGQLFETGGQSHLAFQWTASSLEVADQGRSGGYSIALADEIERMISSGYPHEAIAILSNDSVITGVYRRQLLSKALGRAEDWLALKNLLESPQNEDELAMFYTASENSGDMSGVAEALEIAKRNGEVSTQLLTTLMQRFEVRKKFGGPT